MEIANIYPRDLFFRPVPMPDIPLGPAKELERQQQGSKDYYKWVVEWICGATIKERAARYENVRALMGPSEYRFWTPNVGRALGIDDKALDKVIGKHIFGRIALFRYWNATTYPAQ